MRLQAGRRIRGQAPFLAVLAILVAAVVYLWLFPTHWRRGAGIISVALLVAGVLRLLLSPQRAGLLVVRGRSWDAFCYLALGVVILLVDIRLPH